MRSFRYIFPSFRWEDAWLVNQIVNLPFVIGTTEIQFRNGVPPEEVHSSDDAIRRWIQNSMDGCTCLILFVGEETYKSDWVAYELELARKRSIGRIIVYLDGMKRKDGSICHRGPDPYAYRGMYTSNSPNAYIIKQYSWVQNDGINNIGQWIEDACQRASK